MPETAKNNNEREALSARRESLIAERNSYEDKMFDFIFGKLLAGVETDRKTVCKGLENTLRATIPVSAELHRYASETEIENGSRLRWEVFSDRVKFYESLIAHIVQQIPVENLEAGGKQKFVDLNFEIGRNAKPILKQESGTEWAEAEDYQNYVKKLTTLLIHYGLGEKQSNLNITRTIVNEWSKKGRYENIDPMTEVDETRSKVYRDVVLELVKDEKFVVNSAKNSNTEIELVEGLTQLRGSLNKINEDLVSVIQKL